MTNIEKFKEVWGFFPDCGPKCNPFPCLSEKCKWYERCQEGFGAACDDWWFFEYEPPKKENTEMENEEMAVMSMIQIILNGEIRTFRVQPYVAEIFVELLEKLPDKHFQEGFKEIVEEDGLSEREEG